MWRGEPRVAHSFQKSFCLGHPQPWLAENWRFAPSLPVLQIYFFPPLPATLFCLFVCKTGLLCKHITHGPRTVQIADCSKTFPNHRWSHFFFSPKGEGKKWNVSVEICMKLAQDTLSIYVGAHFHPHLRNGATDGRKCCPDFQNKRGKKMSDEVKRKRLPRALSSLAGQLIQVQIFERLQKQITQRHMLTQHLPSPRKTCTSWVFFLRIQVSLGDPDEGAIWQAVLRAGVLAFCNPN